LSIGRDKGEQRGNNKEDKKRIDTMRKLKTRKRGKNKKNR
jgi:hypothetical protein